MSGTILVQINLYPALDDVGDLVQTFVSGEIGFRFFHNDVGNDAVFRRHNDAAVHEFYIFLHIGCAVRFAFQTADDAVAHIKPGIGVTFIGVCVGYAFPENIPAQTALRISAHQFFPIKRGKKLPEQIHILCILADYQKFPGI